MRANTFSLLSPSWELVGCPWVEPGLLYVTRDQIIATNESCIYHALRGAVVHYNRDRCPTWGDSVECRCMTEERR